MEPSTTGILVVRMTRTFTDDCIRRPVAGAPKTAAVHEGVSLATGSEGHAAASAAVTSASTVTPLPNETSKVNVSFVCRSADDAACDSCADSWERVAFARERALTWAGGSERVSSAAAVTE